MRIQGLLNNYKVTASGFPAVAGLGEFSKEHGTPAVLSTLPASVLAEQGITQYFAPRFNRGQVFNTSEEIIEANIPVDAYEIEAGMSPIELRELASKERTIIVSRHEGTIEVLKGMYPEAPVLSGNVSKEDIEGKHVIGTLPPFLVAHTALYTPVTIRDFDYTVDGDLTGEELDKRMVIGESFRLINVKEEYGGLPSTFAEIKELFLNNYGHYNRHAIVLLPFENSRELYLHEELSRCQEVKLFDYEDDYDNNFGATAVVLNNDEIHILLHGYF